MIPARYPARQRFDRQAEIVVGRLPRRPLIPDRDAALDQAIRESAAILADAIVRLLFCSRIFTTVSLIFGWSGPSAPLAPRCTLWRQTDPVGP